MEDADVLVIDSGMLPFLQHNWLRPPISVELDSGARLPELAGLATDPEEIEWTMALPFDYSALSVTEVIRIISSLGVRWAPSQDGRTAGTVRMKLAEGEGKARDVFFQLLLIEGSPRGRSLQVERVE